MIDAIKTRSMTQPELAKAELIVTDEVTWQPENKSDLAWAIIRLEKELPGWWWSAGACHVSADASIGPDRIGPDAKLLEHRAFDEGFHIDMQQPASCGEALNYVIDEALKAKRAKRAE